jgi:hypothetical protein
MLFKKLLKRIENKITDFIKKKGLSARKQVVISPLVPGANPRDPTKTLIFQNKAIFPTISINKG